MIPSSSPTVEDAEAASERKPQPEPSFDICRLIENPAIGTLKDCRQACCCACQVVKRYNTEIGKPTLLNQPNGHKR
jgi:hypothetical protein